MLYIKMSNTHLVKNLKFTCIFFENTYTCTILYIQNKTTKF